MSVTSPLGNITQTVFEEFQSNNISYFDGYLGGFEFDRVVEIYSKQCTFEIPTDGYDVRKNCIEDCNNPGKDNPNNCSNQDCEDKCRQIKVCGFDSKEIILRHEIDCMNKCIIQFRLSHYYCKEQCFGCGSECWWLKNNVYSNKKQENDRENQVLSILI